MLKIGYNLSEQHHGFKTHCETPERTHKCIRELVASYPEEMFIKNEVSKAFALKLLLAAHTNEYIQTLIHMIPQKITCRKCKKSFNSDKCTFSEFITEFKKCKVCEEPVKDTDLFCYLDNDTYFTNYTFDIVLQGIGVLKTLLDTIKNGVIKYGFALIRPPGHHCENNGQGFCVANNAVIASKYSQKIGYDKVFILDIDFHHGDGTFKLIKEKEENIYMCSIHGYGEGIYPISGGRDENTDHILNIPLAIDRGTSSRHYINDEYYTNIINGEVKVFINKVNPSIIIISCGFDGHCEDPLEGFNLTDDAYVRIVNSLKQYSVPLLFITEGGYSVSAIARTVKKMTDAMC
jgi:acetoin utilization deacetylase AcuC-like enzyme